ncbi:MAG: sn-glycerol-3-phosphate ABC transporter ATP-binding protein UgpC [Bryobacteraceae bacterium]|jgi:multiple sugar transport system ATP-binding protein
MATVELKNVRKRFGCHEVIHGVDLLINDHEFVAFVGPSGSGKSTLLRMIAGLEEISEGEVLIDGLSAQQVPPAKRGLAMVFQSYALYPHMSVAENLSFSLRLAGVPIQERDQKVRAVARTLEMESLLHRKPRELSGGQLQRVALGRAIVRQPKAFLLDEPLSNLDAALQAQMRLELVRLHRELNTTMIYVTHDQVEAMTMADRIVVLNDGRVEQVGFPLELYQHPASLFVAGFIGAPKMNFLDVEVKAATEQSLTLSLFNGISVVVPAPVMNAKAGERLKLGIRPEHVGLAQDGELQGEIEALEHLGPRTYLHARLADGTRFVVQTAGDTSVREGDRLALCIRADASHLFDASGRSLTRRGAGNAVGHHQAV